MSTSTDRMDGGDEAAQACLETYLLCAASEQHCLNARREDRVRACASALRDCADLSLVLANLLSRNSPLALQATALCIEATRHAASAIAGLEHADAQLRATYASCQNLIRVCRELNGSVERSVEDERDEALIETFPASDATPTVVSHAT